MKGKRLTVTDGSMTRFIMSLEEAVELVVQAFKYAESGDIWVQKAPACTIDVLAKAVCKIFGVTDEYKIIGIRHGEKLHETLLTNEECSRAIDMGKYYRVPADNRDLNYDKYFVTGNLKRANISEFTSDNTERYEIEKVVNKLLELNYVKNKLSEWRENNENSYYGV